MKVGVLIPVHGFAPYLAEALDCVFSQGPEVTVVVVDDGSSEPVRLPPGSPARATLVRRDTAGGPAAARATGLAQVPDDVSLIALCDADDAWCPGALAATVTALAADPAAGWAFGRAHVVGPDGRPTGETWAQPADGHLAAHTFGRELYAANPVPTSSVVLRRAALAAVGGFASPVRVAEDWELWLRLCAAGTDARCVAASTVRYRRHAAGLTSDIAGLAAAQLAVHERHAGLVEAHVARAILAGDHAALAAGLARAGDHAGARAAWAQVAARRPLRGPERARRVALAVPVLRGRVGRGDPYRP